MTSHPLSAIPFFAAITLERAGYYGMRAILVLFLISEIINATHAEAFEIYGWGVGVLAVCNLIGGALGFIGQPKILSLIGIGTQAMGTFILAYSETQEIVMVGFGVIGLGAGISRTNLMPFLGQLYHRSKLLDAGMMINYIMVNVGAFLSVIIISLITVELGFKMAFVLCGLLYIAAGVLIAVAKPIENESLNLPEKPNTVFPLIVSLAVFGSTLFWLAYEFITGSMYTLTPDLADNTVFDLVSKTSVNLNAVVVIIFCTALTIYFSFKKVATTLQLGVGFILAILAYLCIAGVDFQSSDSGTIKTALLAFFILASLAEVLVGPPISSYIVRKLDVRYSPMVMAGYYFILAMIMKLQITDGLSAFTWNVIIASIVMLILAGAFIGFYVNGKKYTEQKTEQLDSDFDF